MSLISLPPELVLSTFRIAVDNFPQDDYFGKDYTTNLRSFALVHRKWTFIAQHQLAQSIWLSNNVAKNEKTIAALEKAPFDQTETTRLYWHGGGTLQLENMAEMERFRGIKYLSIDSDVSIETIAKFSQLETLHLRNAALNLVDHSNLSFPKLNRIILAESARIEGDDSFYPHIFNSKAMPQLAHLALDCHALQNSEMLEPLIQHILPLTHSLALNRSDFDPDDSEGYSRILEEVHRLPKLEHLSLALDEEHYPLRILLDRSSTLKLRSLHLSGDEPGSGNGERLIGIAKGEHESIKLEKVVLYGKTRESPGHGYSANELEAFTWISRGGFRCGYFEMEYPPFEDFDGSYHPANLV